MAAEIVLCDTNIFIHWFNNDSDTILKLKSIGLENIALSVISVMELIQGTDNKQQLNRLMKKLNSYKVFHFNEKVSQTAFQIFSQYNLSHNLLIPDSIIAATAIVNKIPIFTYNLKDFKYIPDLMIFDN